MPVRCEQYNDIMLLNVEGDLTSEAAALLRKHIEEGIDKLHVVNAVVDLEKCDFIDSEGLETLLAVKRRLEELFGQFKLVHLDEHCRKILEITRLEHRFECHANLNAAVKSMQ
jgi:anti-anti-sigma factor